MIAQKQMKNLEYFNYLGRMITNDARCTCEIKSRIAMAKAAFNKKRTLFTSKMDLNLRKKLVKCYILGAQLRMVLKIAHFGKQIRNTWKVLLCWRIMKISWTDRVRN
jgi:hypothetical protein